MFDRPLKHGAEKRIVARDEWRMPLNFADRVGDAPDHRYVDQAVGGICRGLDEDHRDPSFAHGVVCRQVGCTFIDAICKAERADRQTGETSSQTAFRSPP